MNKEKYPINIDDQINHLKQIKKVKFNDISEEEAKEILYTYNYAYIITPFKSRFAKLDEDSIVKIDGKRVYENSVEFKEYYDCYINERKNYPIIYSRILTFETKFRAILMNEVISRYSLTKNEQLKNFLEKRIAFIRSQNFEDRSQFISVLKQISFSIKKFNAVHRVFEHLTLNELSILFVSLDIKIREIIFEELMKRENILRFSNLEEFCINLQPLVHIRNSICHGNSLEILLNYSDLNTKSLRSLKSKKLYISLINKMIENN